MIRDTEKKGISEMHLKGMRRVTSIRGSLLAATLMLCAGVASAQTHPNWYKVLVGTPPPARFGAAATYDPVHQKTYMFGGITFSNVGPAMLSDTLSYSFPAWTTLQTNTGPSGRYGMSFSYDAAHANMVLFGGAQFLFNGVIFSLGDTWTFDGATWTQQTPIVSPSARYLYGMAYDPVRDQTVLYGGVNANGYLGDTWIWDGSTWTQKAVSGPPARAGAAVTWDPVRGEIVLFAGVANNGAYDDTWVWNGTSWTQKFPVTSPPARYAAGMAFDTAQGVSVMFSGTNFNANMNDTWTWNGVNWTQMLPSSQPLERFYTMMAYDAKRNELTMFGGGRGTKFGDIYLFDTWFWQ